MPSFKFQATLMSELIDGKRRMEINFQICRLFGKVDRFTLAPFIGTDRPKISETPIISE